MHSLGELPVGSVFRTWCFHCGAFTETWYFHCGGLSSNPSLGNKIPQSCTAAKKKKKVCFRCTALQSAASYSSSSTQFSLHFEVPTLGASPNIKSCYEAHCFQTQVSTVCLHPTRENHTGHF